MLRARRNAKSLWRAGVWGLFALGLVAAQEQEGAAQVEGARPAKARELLRACIASLEQAPHAAPDERTLDKQAAAAWREVLWNEWCALRREAGQDGGLEVSALKDGEQREGQLQAGTQTLRFSIRRVGPKPASGWPLFIHLHGGGNNPKVNDGGWKSAKKKTFRPMEPGLYVTPRSPGDEVEAWISPAAFLLLGELRKQALALWEVDANRVYVLGYSMGGWGTMALAPLLADHWAAAASSAGGGFARRGPPQNLRNTPFMVQVGTEDAPFGRYKLSKGMADALEKLHQADPQGYTFKFVPHEGKKHVIDDGDTVQWLAQFTRQPLPKTVVWRQPGLNQPVDAEEAVKLRPEVAVFLQRRFYWLRADEPLPGQSISARLEGQVIRLEASGARTFTVQLNDALADLDQPVEIVLENARVYRDRPARKLEHLVRSLVERGDPELMFSARVEVNVPKTEASPSTEKAPAVP